MKREDSEKSFTKECKTPCGNIFITCSYRDSDPIELFVNTQKLNYDRQKNCNWALNAIAVAISNLLQLGAPAEKVVKYSDNFHCPMYSESGMTTCPEHFREILLGAKAIIDAK